MRQKNIFYSYVIGYREYFFLLESSILSRIIISEKPWVVTYFSSKQECFPWRKNNLFSSDVKSTDQYFDWFTTSITTQKIYAHVDSSKISKKLPQIQDTVYLTLFAESRSLSYILSNCSSIEHFPRYPLHNEFHTVPQWLPIVLSLSHAMYCRLSASRVGDSHGHPSFNAHVTVKQHIAIKMLVCFTPLGITRRCDRNNQKKRSSTNSVDLFLGYIVLFTI